jgi:hypothetical protein
MGVSGQRHAPAAHYARGRTPVPTVQNGWASEPVWTQRLREKKFKDIIAVYCDNHTNPKIQNATLLTVEAGGTNSYQWDLTC